MTQIHYPANVLEAMIAFLDHHYADDLDEVAKQCLSTMSEAVDALRSGAS